MVHLGDGLGGGELQLIAQRRPLASALDKIERAARGHPLPASFEAGPVSSMMVANPFSGRAVMRMFSTHPDTQERITRLWNMADTQRR